MNKDAKINVVLMAPVETSSGYGARSRDIATALIANDKFDVKILSTAWGKTQTTGLNLNEQAHVEIANRLLPNNQMTSKPDLFVQVTVPNEFQPLGKYNIGVTAGIETTLISAQWIQGCNKMDMVIVPSQHSMKVLTGSVWTEEHKQSGMKRDHKVTKPVKVLFEGVDLNKYFATKEINKTVHDQLKSIKEDFCYLFVGHWLSGDLGQDRKDVGGLIKTFLETFKGKGSKNQPALILKTSSFNSGPVDRHQILAKIKQVYDLVGKGKSLPRIYLLHGDLTDEEMNSLYNHPKIKAHITFTKGEGYGRPLAEASVTNKPIIASNWSGHTDFLQHALLLPGKLTRIHPSASWKDVLIPESSWFSADYAYASEAIKDVFTNYENHLPLAKKQAKLIAEQFSLEAMTEQLNTMLDQELPAFPKALEIPLPKLKKVNPQPVDEPTD